jgi:aminoglycoside N3'-acetyltransferase
MPVPTTTREALRAHLIDLGLERGMHIAVHARFVSFGRIEGGAATVLSVFREILGDKGTLVFPTYTLNLDANTPYSATETPSYAMGVLSEFARLQPDAQRTLCPMHGHVAIGAKADIIMAADPMQPLGRNSVFAAMHDADFGLLLLGCSFHEGATYIHHVEAIVGVPYREWLDLPRLIQKQDGSVESVSCRYYARRNGAPWRTDLSSVERRVQRDGVGTCRSIGKRSSYFLQHRELHQCVKNMLDESPYALMQQV